MKEKLHNYDPATDLDSPEAIEIFMADAFESGDAAYIAKALQIADRAKSMLLRARTAG
ncbi:DNA-binding protein [Pelagibius sp. Alg239-R121]|uniref:helix-turn-helix domain-containing transcriptional regulator n=1 Tax=Pelagibius sp. Alg239-R121 TaxID=2993448 RepID=UPI0024A6E2B4|nr:hypothetical protein [Pelagibius sp. Alg239-R121]